MARQIKWCNYTWSIKTGIEGPGPNNWSDDEKDVYVDEKGHLHLKIINRNGKWYCTEVAGEILGYGTYVFEVKDTKQFADNAVLGLFVYQDDDHEIDIEIARWGKVDGLNIDFVVQQKDLELRKDPTRHHGFYIDPTLPSINSFTWSESEVNFKTESGGKTEQWKYPLSFIPKAEKEKVILNFWLFEGEPPLGHKEEEVVITKFRFIKEML